MGKRGARAGRLIVWLVAGAACATHNVPTASIPAASSTLEVVSVTPAKGTAVAKETVVVAELAYSVSNFEKRRFFVMAQLATDNPLRTTGGRTPLAPYVELADAKGRLSLAFPIASVWDLPEVKKPFRMWFYLTQDTGPKRNLVVAKTAPIDYVAE